MSRDLVIDASVGIKLFVDEDLSEVTDKLFAQLAADPPAQFYVPDLFFIECTNVLWKYVWRFGYPAENARQDVIDLRALSLITVSTADLLEPALEVALKYEITAYDACYIALAELLALPFVTVDATLARKLVGSQIDVQELKDIQV
jgi:predicted nucleic acid-binding protein